MIHARRKIYLKCALISFPFLIASSAQHWGYTDQKIIEPEAWGDIEGAELCNPEKGTRQSPIGLNLKSKSYATTNQTISLHYDNNLEFMVFHNRHTIQATLVNKQSSNRLSQPKVVVTKGKGSAIYHLRQFHLHRPSEHQIDSGNGHEASFAELHFVHEHSSKPGQLLVLAVLVKIAQQGEATEMPSKVINNLVQAYKQSSDYLTGLSALKLNVQNLLTSSDKFVTYKGSLTTPPCSENVTWVVLTEPLYVSEKDVKLLQQYISIGFENNRPLQTLQPHHNVEMSRGLQEALWP